MLVVCVTRIRNYLVKNLMPDTYIPCHAVKVHSEKCETEGNGLHAAYVRQLCTYVLIEMQTRLPRSTVAALYCRCFRLMPFNANFCTWTTGSNKTKIEYWMYSWQPFKAAMRYARLNRAFPDGVPMKRHFSTSSNSHSIDEHASRQGPVTRTRKKRGRDRDGRTINRFIHEERWRRRRWRRPKPSLAICFITYSTLWWSNKMRNIARKKLESRGTYRLVAPSHSAE